MEASVEWIGSGGGRANVHSGRLNTLFGWASGAKIAIVLVLPLLGPSAHALTFVLLASWALLGARTAIEALTLSWLATFLNPGIYELSEAASVLRWLVLVSAAVGVTWEVALRRGRAPRTLIWLLCFATVAGGFSLAVSYAPVISLLKVLSFSLATGTILLGFHVSRAPSDHWERWFLTLFGVVVLLGLPLVGTEVGFFRNQRGFQGVLNHPQAYGTFLGAMVPWVFFLSMEARNRRRLWPLILIGVVSLVLTQSRTAALAALGGTVLVLLWKMWPRRGAWRAVRPRTLVLWSLLGLVLMLGFVYRSEIRAASLDFALKGEVDASLEDSFRGSRGLLIARSWANFQEHPLTGIGFGLPSVSSELSVQRGPWGDMPVGASVEKGFAVTAALEELGLLGTASLLVFLVSWIAPVVRRGAPRASAALAAGAVLVNFGEAVLFAMGGTGLLIWCLLGTARKTALEAAP